MKATSFFCAAEWMSAIGLTRELRSWTTCRDNAPFLHPVPLLSHPRSGCQAAGPPRPPGGWSARRKPSRGGAARAPPPSPPSTPPRLREGRPTASGSHAHATRPGTEGQGRRRPGKLRDCLPGSAIVATQGGSRLGQRVSLGFAIATRHATRPNLKSRTRTEHLTGGARQPRLPPKYRRLDSTHRPSTWECEKARPITLETLKRARGRAVQARNLRFEPLGKALTG
jgi:hypothetical protein